MERIWDVLQIEVTKDKKEIKRAYARLSREIHPEEKPEEFRRLYDAYQKALRYASSDEKPEGYTEDFEAGPETETKEEGVLDSENWDSYEKFGFHIGDAQNEQLRLKKIEHFLYCWDRDVLAGAQAGTFLTQDWKEYLKSEDFQKIMWSPVVLKTVEEGMKRYFLREEETVFFFWDLYGFEKSKEEDYQEEELQLYETLYRAHKNCIIRQKNAENMAANLEKRQKYRKKVVITSILGLIGIIPAIFVMAFIGVPVELSVGISGAAFLFLIARLVTGYIEGE